MPFISHVLTGGRALFNHYTGTKNIRRTEVENAGLATEPDVVPSSGTRHA